MCWGWVCVCVHSCAHHPSLAATGVGPPPKFRIVHSKSAVYTKLFLEESTVKKPSETESNNRSVMPLDALGRTRATMPDTAGSIPAPTGAGNPLKVLLLVCRVVFAHPRLACLGLGLAILSHKRGMPSSDGSLRSP